MYLYLLTRWNVVCSQSKLDESDMESGSRLGAAKKLSKEGPQVLRRVTVVTRPPDKDYLKELEIGE